MPDCQTGGTGVDCCGGGGGGARRRGGILGPTVTLTRPMAVVATVGEPDINRPTIGFCLRALQLPPPPDCGGTPPTARRGERQRSTGRRRQRGSSSAAAGAGTARPGGDAPWSDPQLARQQAAGRRSPAARDWFWSVTTRAAAAAAGRPMASAGSRFRGTAAVTAGHLSRPAVECQRSRGTPNTGSGGGGRTYFDYGALGGSGVVFVRIPLAQSWMLDAVGGVVSTLSGCKLHTFTTSGTFRFVARAARC